jgi:NAD(P)-dependent dehydrogenase (short-subunit alcohol dehydrogenase family)
LSETGERQLDGCRILVVGANGGVGSALAREVARRGATVILLGRRVAALERLYDDIEKSGAPQPAIYPFNLEGATPAEYDEMALRLREGLGGIDVVVQAAARLHGLTPLELIEPEEWLRTWQVNLHAPFFLWRALLPSLANGVSPSILALVDEAAKSTEAYWGAYGIAQAALRGLVGMAANEWESARVKVLGVQPPPLATALRRKAYVSEALTGLAAAAPVAATIASIIARRDEFKTGSFVATETLQWT